MKIYVKRIYASSSKSDVMRICNKYNIPYDNCILIDVFADDITEFNALAASSDFKHNFITCIGSAINAFEAESIIKIIEDPTNKNSKPHQSLKSESLYWTLVFLDEYGNEIGLPCIVHLRISTHINDATKRQLDNQGKVRINKRGDQFVFYNHLVGEFTTDNQEDVIDELHKALLRLRNLIIRQL